MSKFINPAVVIAQCGITAGQIVVDFGCGSGFYVLPAAQLVGNSGMVYAVDVVESKLAAAASIASQFGYKNIKFVRADLASPVTVLPTDFCDMVVVANILHQVSSPEQVLKNAYKILKTGGKALVVEWKKGIAPIGPPMSARIEPQKMEILAMAAGLRRDKVIDTDSFHYAEIYTK